MPKSAGSKAALTWMMAEGEPLCGRAERLRVQLFEPGAWLGDSVSLEQNPLKAEAAKLVAVSQRPSTNVAG